MTTFLLLRYLTKDERAGSAEGVKLLDELLSQLVSSVDVDVMAGEHDPANQLMPQQPLHPCLFLSGCLTDVIMFLLGFSN